MKRKKHESFFDVIDEIEKERDERILKEWQENHKDKEHDGKTTGFYS